MLDKNIFKSSTSRRCHFLIYYDDFEHRLTQVIQRHPNYLAEHDEPKLQGVLTLLKQKLESTSPQYVRCTEDSVAICTGPCSSEDPDIAASGGMSTGFEVIYTFPELEILPKREVWVFEVRKGSVL